MRSPDAFERSRRKLFRTLQRELAEVERAKDARIRAYERSFRRALPARAPASSPAALLKRAANAAVVLVGDYHPFRQSQKGFLRLLREARATAGPARPLMIGLECVQQKYQAQLDHFSAGFITLEELRDGIDFELYWPFPWENYREIFAYARAAEIPLLALNIPERRRMSEELHRRDEAAADRVSTALAENPRRQLFVLYGELHLAEPHLPRRLRAWLPRRRVLVVHQNEPRLYWNAPRARDGHRPEVLRLKPDEFCLLNSVPWLKLRAYLDWIEGSLEDDWEEGTDAHAAVMHFARLLAEALGQPAPAGEGREVLGPARLADHPPRWRGEDAQLLKHARQHQRVSLAPEAGAVLVPALSTNALTEAAALWLYPARSGSPASEAWLLQFLSGYLGSKLLNPNRKCQEEADLRTYLAALPAAARARRPQARLFARALTLLKPWLHGGRSRGPALAPAAEVEAHRLAGYVLANRLFLAHERGRRGAARTLQQIFSAGGTPRELLTKIAREIES